MSWTGGSKTLASGMNCPASTATPVTVAVRPPSGRNRCTTQLAKIWYELAICTSCSALPRSLTNIAPVMGPRPTALVAPSVTEASIVTSRPTALTPPTVMTKLPTRLNELHVWAAAGAETLRLTATAATARIRRSMLLSPTRAPAPRASAGSLSTTWAARGRARRGS